MLEKLTLALAASLALWGCKKDDDHHHDGTEDHDHDGTEDHDHDTEDDTPETTETTDTEPSPAANRAARAIMAKYEVCRAKLAADDSAIADCAKEIASVASSASSDLSGAAQDAAGRIARAATALAETKGGDIGALRIGFGEVSKPVEALLTATPKVAADYKMYECPMAKGFKRWAQPDMGDDHAMANPYMGKEMLQCGSEVHDHHKGMSGDMSGDHMGAGDGGDLLAREKKAHEAARPVLAKHCASCHTKAGDGPKKAKRKAREHFAMDSYPYGGHHLAELGETIREVLGADGSEPTMPKDDPGAVEGDELAAVVAWTRARDKAAKAKAGHHGDMKHGDHHH